MSIELGGDIHPGTEGHCDFWGIPRNSGARMNSGIRIPGEFRGHLTYLFQVPASGALAYDPTSINEVIAIRIIGKNFSTLNSSYNDVMECSRGIYPGFSWHKVTAIRTY